MAPSLESRPFTPDGVCAGAERFLLGLGKKALVADVFGSAVSKMSASPMDGPTAWLLVLYFSLQMYLDFSGYSDMSIGLGRMFGFSFRENFNFPYLSTSISEFWRRWHISLGAWFREYVYIPLGGGRRGSVYLNLLIIFLLTGMWHGSPSIYLCWGLWHGLFVLAERTPLYRRIREKLPCAGLPGWAYTMLVVGLGWQCFRLRDVSDFFAFLKNLAGIPAGTLQFSWRFYLTPKLLTLSLLTAAGIWALSRPGVQARLRKWNEASPLFCAAKYAALLAVLALSFCAIVANGYTPFLYFQY